MCLKAGQCDVEDGVVQPDDDQTEREHGERLPATRVDPRIDVCRGLCGEHGCVSGSQASAGTGAVAPCGAMGFGSECAAGDALPWSSRGSHSSQRGRYQFQSPSSFIVAGSNTTRTTVASTSIATARPTPNSLRNMNWRLAKIANTPTITSAALVTT